MELEANDIIIRNEYHQIPTKVEYSLSETGRSLIPILEECVNGDICTWNNDYSPTKHSLKKPFFTHYPFNIRRSFFHETVGHIFLIASCFFRP